MSPYARLELIEPVRAGEQLFVDLLRQCNYAEKQCWHNRAGPTHTYSTPVGFRRYGYYPYPITRTSTVPADFRTDTGISSYYPIPTPVSKIEGGHAPAMVESVTVRRWDDGGGIEKKRVGLPSIQNSRCIMRVIPKSRILSGV